MQPGGGEAAGGGRRGGHEDSAGKLVRAVDWLAVSTGNLNRGVVNKTRAERDKETTAFLTSYDSVARKELYTYRVPKGMRNQGEPVDGMNLELVGSLNSGGFNRRQFLELIILGRARSAEGKTLWGMIKADFRKAEELSDRIRKEKGNPVPIPDHFSEPPALLKA